MQGQIAMTKKADISKLVPSEFLPSDDGTNGTIEPEAPATRIERPGIYQLSNEEYHGGPGVSRSTLWTLFTKTPFHARYGSHKQTKPQRIGDATGVAVLEPDLFEKKFYRGPIDRRGKKWDAAEEIAKQSGKVALPEREYDEALRIGDAVLANPKVRKLLSGQPSIEQSAYAIDEATGELVKVRPDVHNHKLAIQADLKTAADASPTAFAASCADYGYHVQRAMYPLIWEAAGGGRINAFVFIVVESAAPWPSAIYELETPAVEEGLEVYRHALDDYHRCMQRERSIRHENEIKKNQGKEHLDDAKLEAAIRKVAWPGLPTDVMKIDLPRWGYKLRQPV